MKERPILFGAPMIRALLAGTKTQTRRILKPQPTRVLEHMERVADSIPPVRIPDGWEWKDLYGADDGGHFADAIKWHSPYGIAGDRLWVRETFQPVWAGDKCPGSMLEPEGWALRYPATDGWQEYHHPDRGLTTAAKPGIHMPRWASRITLEVTKIRAERLHAIDELDALAEGVEGQHVEGVLDGKHGEYVVGQARDAFARLWDEINGDRAEWESNPWVWVVEFKRVDAQIARAA